MSETPSYDYVRDGYIVWRHGDDEFIPFEEAAAEFDQFIADIILTQREADAVIAETGDNGTRPHPYNSVVGWARKRIAGSIRQGRP